MQRKGPSRYSKAMSMGMATTTLRDQLSGPLSLEYLKSLLALDVVSGNDSKKPEAGTGWGCGPPSKVRRLKLELPGQRPDVQLTWASNSAFTAGATPTRGFRLGDFFLLKKKKIITITTKIKRSVCVPLVCVSVHATTETVRKIRYRTSKCCPF